MEMILAQDIVGCKRTYGKAGDRVRVVADHVDVLIVEGDNKVRFPLARILLKVEALPESIPIKTETKKAAVWAEPMKIETKPIKSKTGQIALF
jgi:hypothetical protein